MSNVKTFSVVAVVVLWMERLARRVLLVDPRFLSEMSADVNVPRSWLEKNAWKM